jgi:hypothetical protein
VIAPAAAVGKRLTVKQATKYVPLAGQAISALIGYKRHPLPGRAAHHRTASRSASRRSLQLPPPR